MVCTIVRYVKEDTLVNYNFVQYQIKDPTIRVILNSKVSMNEVRKNHTASFRTFCTYMNRKVRQKLIFNLSLNIRLNNKQDFALNNELDTHRK